MFNDSLALKFVVCTRDVVKEVHVGSALTLDNLGSAEL
jgi:hypothetical protein